VTRLPRLDIDAASWAELSPLLDAALDLAPSERADWLAALDRDESLKSRLRDLLAPASGIETRDFLAALPRLDVRPETADHQGDHLGPYRLVRELGSGGMGTVWLAERADGLINRPVALKFPRGLWIREGLRERMARERELLASLEHPGIARLYDAGLTESGDPYLALEYVEGRPLDEHCATRQLGVRARLELFLQVADAVAYAHSKLIVHRDLKPANILVTQDGSARLLDFGIGKLLDEQQARDARLTELSGQALTPDYASPEQIAGQPPTVATDVYSLGVILYELLTGQRPYRLKRDSRGALEDAILEAEPQRPSQIVTRPASRRQIRGDLDAITLKALKKRPTERYTTVESFADDVRRHLAGHPVAARPDGPAYRVGKFLRRHKLAVGTVTAACTLVIAGAGVALWQASVAIDERNRAEQVTAFIASIFQGANPYQEAPSSISGIDLLRQAVERIEAQAGLPGRTRMELMNIVAESFYGLGDYPAALELLDRVIPFASAEAGDTDPTTLRAKLLRMDVKRMQGDTQFITESLPPVMRYLEAHADRHPDLLLHALLVEGHAALDTGRYAEAIASARRAMDLAQALPSANETSLFGAALMIAVSLQYQNDPDAALSAAREAFAIAEVHLADDPDHAQWIDALALLGRAEGNAGMLRLAIEHLQDAVTRARRRLGERNPVVGFYLSDIARYQLAAGEIEAAADTSEESFEIIEGFAEPASYTYGMALVRTADVHGAARRFDDAVRVYEKATEILVGALGPDHEVVLITRIALWLNRAHRGGIDEAETALLELPSGQHESPRLARRLAAANVLLQLLNGGGPALRDAVESLRPWVTRETGVPGEYAQLKSLLGAALSSLGDLENARAHLIEAAEIFEEQRSPLHPSYVDTLVALGKTELALGRPLDALPLLQRADEYWSARAPESRWAGEAALWLGRCRLELEDTVEAREALERARRVLEHSPLPIDAGLLALTARD
jgi:eukaryotic-like serine/threonine-protein kinase